MAYGDLTVYEDLTIYEYLMLYEYLMMYEKRVTAEQLSPFLFLPYFSGILTNLIK